MSVQVQLDLIQEEHQLFQVTIKVALIGGSGGGLRAPQYSSGHKGTSSVECYTFPMAAAFDWLPRRAGQQLAEDWELQVPD